MNFLKYFIIVNDLSLILPGVDFSLLSSFENAILILISNLCIWFFIFVIFNIIFKILVRVR